TRKPCLDTDKFEFICPLSPIGERRFFDSPGTYPLGFKAIGFSAHVLICLGPKICLFPYYTPLRIGTTASPCPEDRAVEGRFGQRTSTSSGSKIEPSSIRAPGLC